MQKKKLIYKQIKMEEKDETILPIGLTPEQCNLLLMTISSGMINFETHQKLSSVVFQNTANEENIGAMLKRISEIGMTIQSQLQAYYESKKPKSEIEIISPLSKV